MKAAANVAPARQPEQARWGSAIIRWDSPPHGPDLRIADGPWGRYLVKRERPRARSFVVTLDSKRTSYGGDSREDAMRAIERVIVANWPEYRLTPTLWEGKMDPAILVPEWQHVGIAYVFEAETGGFRVKGKRTPRGTGFYVYIGIRLRFRHRASHRRSLQSHLNAPYSTENRNGD